MKSFIIMVCTLILAGGGFANPYKILGGNGTRRLQNSGQPVNFAGTKIFKFSIFKLAASDSTDFMNVFIPDTKNVNPRALKDFQVRIHDASRVMWYSDGTGFISYFAKDGFTNRVYYNKNGRWQYSLIYYTKDKLPRNISTIIKSSFADLDIDIVVETQTTYGVAYVVYMRNQSTIRILKVNAEGEMATIYPF